MCKEYVARMIFYENRRKDKEKNQIYKLIPAKYLRTRKKNLNFAALCRNFMHYTLAQLKGCFLFWKLANTRNI